MTAKKPTLKPEDQIAHMETVLAGYKSQLSETNDELSALRQRHTETYNAGEKWRKRAVELETEVGQLRDELHGMTVEKARLEGYIDRARQFDPEPEPIMVTVPESMIRPPRNRPSEMFTSEAMAHYGSKDRPQPWYKRDV